MMATASKNRSPARRLAAQERRAEIVDAAIALRAGVSQPYLFALSGAKRNLFIAAVRPGFARMRAVIVRAAAQDGEGGDALNGVHAALLPLRRERTLLLLQLHALAACQDLDVRAVTRAESEETRRALASASGAPGRLLRSVLAEQALLSAAAAMDLPEAWS